MKRHHTDLFSLFFGILFAAIAAWWIFGTTANAARTAGWSAIGLLVILGIVGLVSAVNRQGTPSVSADPVQPTDSVFATDVTSGGDPFAAGPAPSAGGTAEPEAEGRHADTMVLGEPEDPASDDTAVLPQADPTDGAATQPQPRWGGEPEGGPR
ncbi:MAG: hypothetical protein QOD41_4229 [Cryptosporangiaceae bacterium]|nr:hypothetical protein [Cryptosporangiaceae bacterium]